VGRSLRPAFGVVAALHHLAHCLVERTRLTLCSGALREGRQSRGPDYTPQQQKATLEGVSLLQVHSGWPMETPPALAPIV
jgi:hypothetical protein